MRTFVPLLLFVAAFAAWPQGSGPVTVLERGDIVIERGEESATHSLSLTLVYFGGGSWDPESIRSAVRQSARIFGQCGLVLAQADLVHIDAPERYRYFYTPDSRELARVLPLRKPAIYFVIDTHQRPAFDAEAIGRSNSKPRPELADTVWVARGTRDLGIVLAHELAHVLMDSGEHSESPGNLMREDTAPENTRLLEGQCARLRESGTANGLLQPAR